MTAIYSGFWTQHVRSILLRVLWKSDATTIRLMLAIASLLWFLGSVIHPETFNTTAYKVLDVLAGGHIPPWGWGCLFLLHFLGVTWRTFDPVDRIGWGLLINSYGLFIWLSVTLALTYVIQGLSVGTSTDWALCLFAAWALYRTGSANDSVSP